MKDLAVSNGEWYGRSIKSEKVVTRILVYVCVCAQVQTCKDLNITYPMMNQPTQMKNNDSAAQKNTGWISGVVSVMPHTALIWQH